MDQYVTIALAPEYKMPAAVSSALPTVKLSSLSINHIFFRIKFSFHLSIFQSLQAMEGTDSGGADSSVKKAEDVVSGMLAKGFILGKDALNKARSFDERHQLTSTAGAKVASLDQKIGFTEKISAGTTIVNDKVKEMDEKYQVSEKTKSAFSAAEQSVSSAGSAIMKNRYVLTGTTWVTGAFSRVSKAAGEVGQMAKEKVQAEEEHGSKEGGNAQTSHESQSQAATASATTTNTTTVKPSNSAEPQELIL